MRRETEIARQREKEIRDLYAFSRQLARSDSTSDIFDAIQQHLSSLVRRRVALFEPRGPAGKSQPIGEATSAEHRERSRRDRRPRGAADIADGKGNLWLVPRSRRRRPSSASSPSTSAGSTDSPTRRCGRIEALLDEAATTLERLGLSHALTEARMRTEAERFRDALIGSVSHELRTPLASILGAATVLCGAPAVPGSRASPLSPTSCARRPTGSTTRSRTCSTRRGSAARGCSPNSNGSSPPISSTRRSSGGAAACHSRGRVDLPDELLLLHVDSVLIEQALGRSWTMPRSTRRPVPQSCRGGAKEAISCCR